jgi:hypothetical protein
VPETLILKRFQWIPKIHVKKHSSCTRVYNSTAKKCEDIFSSEALFAQNRAQRRKARFLFSRKLWSAADRTRQVEEEWRSSGAQQVMWCGILRNAVDFLGKNRNILKIETFPAALVNKGTDIDQD